MESGGKIWITQSDKWEPPNKSHWSFLKFFSWVCVLQVELMPFCKFSFTTPTLPISSNNSNLFFIYFFPFAYWAHGSSRCLQIPAQITAALCQRLWWRTARLHCERSAFWRERTRCARAWSRLTQLKWIKQTFKWPHLHSLTNLSFKPWIFNYLPVYRSACVGKCWREKTGWVRGGVGEEGDSRSEWMMVTAVQTPLPKHTVYHIIYYSDSDCLVNKQCLRSGLTYLLKSYQLYNFSWQVKHSDSKQDLKIESKLAPLLSPCDLRSCDLRWQRFDRFGIRVSGREKPLVWYNVAHLTGLGSGRVQCAAGAALTMTAPWQVYLRRGCLMFAPPWFPPSAASSLSPSHSLSQPLSPVPFSLKKQNKKRKPLSHFYHISMLYLTPLSFLKFTTLLLLHHITFSPFANKSMHLTSFYISHHFKIMTLVSHHLSSLTLFLWSHFLPIFLNEFFYSTPKWFITNCWF